jgi:hypothetical protein
MSVTAKLLEQSHLLNARRNTDEPSEDVEELRKKSFASIFGTCIYQLNAINEEFDVRYLQHGIRDAAISQRMAVGILREEEGADADAKKADGENKKGMIKTLMDYVKKFWNWIVDLFNKALTKVKDMVRNYEKFGKANAKTDFSKAQVSITNTYEWPMDAIKTGTTTLMILKKAVDAAKNPDDSPSKNSISQKLGYKEDVVAEFVDAVRGKEVAEKKFSPSDVKAAAAYLANSTSVIKIIDKIKKESEASIKSMSAEVSKMANDENFKDRAAALRIVAPIVAQVSARATELIMARTRLSYDIVKAALSSIKKAGKSS